MIKVALIGETSLLIACAEHILKNKKHCNVSLICTPNVEVIAWCRAQNVDHVTDIKDFETHLTRIGVDYLFSIVNYQYLSISLLSSIKQLAINYHDALLPRYAGVNAPSWAIYNNEIEHGVTWHVMTVKFDAGDILEQLPVSIDKDETAFSLNIKCYEAALWGFKTLFAKLLKNKLTFTKQDVLNRSYYGYKSQLPRFGIIDWNDRAEDIIRMVRCCTFDKYPNRFGLVKCLIGAEIYYVDQVEEVKGRNISPLPGRIIALDRKGLTVETGTMPLKLTRLLDGQGNLIDIQDVSEKSHFDVGSCLPILSEENYTQCEKCANAVASHEDYWLKQFLNAEPLNLPSGLIQQGESKNSISFSLSSLSLDKKEDLIALLYIYIYRIRNQEARATFIGLTNQQFPHVPFKILGEYLPLRLSLIGRKKFSELVDHICFVQRENIKNKAFTQDLFIRHPEFQNNEIGSKLFPPVIIHQGHIEDLQWGETTQLVVVLSQDQKQCTFFAKLPKPELEIMFQRLQHMAKFIPREECITHYPLLTESEYQRTIFDWNKTKKPYPKDKTIPELFEDQVKKTPNNIAVVYEDKRFTYAELNEAANQLAHYLKKKFKIKPNDLIVLCLDRSEYMLIAILAVLKAGGAYVPIDPKYPTTRIKFVLNDTKTKVLLVNQVYVESLTKILPTQGADILALDNELSIEQFRQQPKVNIPGLSKDNDLAYVIYTSGTTGEPKGVMIEHKGIVNRIKWMNDQYPLTVADKILQKTPYTFDVSVWELFWACWYGATLIFAKPEGHKDLSYIIELMKAESITIIHFVPSMLGVFIETLQKELPQLRHIFCSGEALTLEQVKMCHGLLPKAKIHNLYGPTEASVDVLFYDCSDKKIGAIYIGKPINNTVCYVLDNHLAPLPIGVVGELYIGGIGLARGYLNKPDLTATRFIENPFQTEEERRHNKNAKLYKTGDLVRWVSSGYMEYIGRSDLQVKIKGARIELGEIETVFSCYPGVIQCAVLVKKRHSSSLSSVGSEFLVGYYLPDKELNEDKLFQYFQDSLPDYMVPAFLVKLDELPLTFNGKLDRQALAKIELPTIGQDLYVAPQTDLENSICEIWAEVLHLPFNRVGIEDDFFMLGGDSILAIRLVSLLNTRFNWHLRIQDLYNFKCISALINSASSTVSKNQVNKLTYLPFSLVNKADYKNKLKDFDLVEDIYPTTYLQNGMLVEASLDHNGTYHDVFVYSIDAKYDGEKFLSIWKQLVEKNELLRASFFLSAEGFCVAIYKEAEIDLRIYEDLDTKKLIADERLNKFDYNKPALFRLLINNYKDHFELLFSFHHSIADGWSVASLIQEFIQAYTNEKTILQNVPLRYGEFVQDELIALKDERAIFFWEEYLHDANIAKAQWKKNIVKSEDSLYCLSFDLDEAQVNLIHQIVKTLRVSADTLFLLIYLKTLSHYLSNKDITIGLVVNNRLEKTGGDQIFGLFLNTIPIRFNFGKHKTVHQQLLELFNVKINMQKFKKIPYGYIKKRFKQKSYDFAFNFIHFHILNDNLDNLESFVGYERTSIPFTLNVFQRWNSNFCIKISVHDDFADRDLLNEFMGYYISILNDTLVRC